MKNDFSFPKGHLVDLTHNYSTETIYWPTEEGFKLDTEFDGMTEKGYYYSAKKFPLQNMAAHTWMLPFILLRMEKQLIKSRWTSLLDKPS